MRFDQSFMWKGTTMTNRTTILRDGVISGGCATIGSTMALAAAARMENKAAVRPVNATSHWLNGDGAGVRESVDGIHTGVGFLTNAAASIFWAAFFEAWRVTREPAAPLPMLRDALAMSAIAAAVDYGATPRRFTPGWELVLSRRSMALAYGGLAAGLAMGALLTQARRRRAG